MSNKIESSWSHKGQHVDGVWFKIFPTIEEATQSMLDFCPGRTIRKDIQYVDDFGGTHILTDCPKDFTPEQMLMVYEAWEKHECGIERTESEDVAVELWETWFNAVTEEFEGDSE